MPAERPHRASANSRLRSFPRRAWSRCARLTCRAICAARFEPIVPCPFGRLADASKNCASDYFARAMPATASSALETAVRWGAGRPGSDLSSASPERSL